MSDLFGVSRAASCWPRSRLAAGVAGPGGLGDAADRRAWTSRSSCSRKLVAGRLRTDPGYLAIQQIPGVGPVLAAVFVAEIGDITRFARPAQLA